MDTTIEALMKNMNQNPKALQGLNLVNIPDFVLSQEQEELSDFRKTEQNIFCFLALLNQMTQSLGLSEEMVTLFNEICNGIAGCLSSLDDTYIRLEKSAAHKAEILKKDAFNNFVTKSEQVETMTNGTRGKQAGKQSRKEKQSAGKNESADKEESASKEQASGKSQSADGNQSQSAGKDQTAAENQSADKDSSANAGKEQAADKEVEFVGKRGVVDLTDCPDIPNIFGYAVSDKEISYMKEKLIIIDPTTKTRIPLYIGPHVPSFRIPEPKKGPGKASKAGIAKHPCLKQLLLNPDHIKVKYHHMGEDWKSEHPTAIPLDPDIFLSFEQTQPQVIPVLHVSEVMKDYVDLDPDEQALNDIREECGRFELELRENGADGSDEDGKPVKKGRPYAEKKIKEFRAYECAKQFRRSSVSPSLLATLLYRSFGLYLPYYRQMQDYRLNGIHISDQLMNLWARKGAEILKPIWLEMAKDMRSLSYLGADESYMKDLELMSAVEGGKGVYVGFTSGRFEAIQLSVLFFRSDRAGNFLLEYLDEDKEYHLITDAFKTYFTDFIVNAVCHDHNRRHFVTALKADGSFKAFCSLFRAGNGSFKDKDLQKFLNQKGHEKLKDICSILELYQSMYHFEFVYKQEKLIPEQISERRLAEARPVLDGVYKVIDQYCLESPAEAKKAGKKYTEKTGKLGEAITYAQNQREYLYTYLEDGRIDISNIRQEAMFKALCKIRDNLLFFATVEGARNAAIFMSIIQTCLMNGINPQRYMEYVFRNFDPDDIGCLERLSQFTPYSSSLPAYLKIDSTEDVPAEWKPGEFTDLYDADLYREEIMEFVTEEIKKVESSKKPDYVDEPRRERHCSCLW